MTAAGRSTLFIGIMTVGSGLTLLRTFVIASVLEPAAFGQYASLVATGGYLATLLSLGLVEGSFKHYPRLHADRRFAGLVEIWQTTRNRLFGRALILLPLMVLAAMFLPSFTAMDGAWIIAIAAGIALCSLGASVLRAAPDTMPLAYANLARAGVALCLGTAGAWAIGASGALTAEALAAGVFLAFVWWRQQQLAREAGDPTPWSADELSAQRREGMTLFFAMLCATAPIYLDRLIVRMTVDPETLGTYSFLATLILAATVLTGMVAQLLGPGLVRMAPQDPSGRARNRRLAVVALAVLAAIGFCAAVGGWALLNGPLTTLGARYELTWPLVMLAGLVAGGQVSVLGDWLLISMDQETAVLATSGLFLVAALLAFAVFVINDGPLEFLFTGLVGAKILHLLAQGGVLRRHRRRVVADTPQGSV